MARPLTTRRDINIALVLATYGFGVASLFWPLFHFADVVMVRLVYGDAAAKEGLVVVGQNPKTLSNGEQVGQLAGLLAFVGTIGAWIALTYPLTWTIRFLSPATYTEWAKFRPGP